MRKISDHSQLQRVMRKKFGARSATLASDLEALGHIPYGVSSQCLSLDFILGRPGFPAGRLTEIVGLTHQGKSTLGYHVLAECQRLGGVAVLLETEQAFEASRLRAIGVNTDALLLFQPEHIEQALDMISVAMHQLRVVDKVIGPIVLVLDTIAGMPTAVELEGGYEEKFMATAARSIAFGLRKLIRPLAEYKVVLLFLNQLRSSMEQYGEKWISYGGKAISSSSSIRLRLRSRQADLVRVNGKLIGTWTSADTIKNKLAVPFQLTKYLLNFDKGIDPIEDLWRAALVMKVLTVKAKEFQFSLNGKSMSVNRSKFEEFVMSKFKSPTLLRERLTKLAIEQKLIKPYGNTE